MTEAANIEKRLKEMGYEFISSDGNNYTYRCKHCGVVTTKSKTEINHEYTSKTWNLCDGCGFINYDAVFKLGTSPRSIISRVKKSRYLQQEIEKRTGFLNAYKPDIIERVYCVVNGISELPTCKYCGRKAKWLGRFQKGYSETCGSKECLAKQASARMEGATTISENRDAAFDEWQRSVARVDDDIVKENIKYDKWLSRITNPILLDYFKNRFPDSDSIEETLQRIKLGVERKPECANPNCHNPVKWIGRKRALYTKYCCDACSANSVETVRKRKETNTKKWGSPNVYDSPAYKQKCIEEFGKPYMLLRPDVAEKIKRTNLERYGTEHPTQNPKVTEKVRHTSMEKYGVDWPSKIPEVRERKKRTNVERYGVESTLDLPSARENAYSKETIEKTKRTNEEKYGVSTPLQIPSVITKAHSEKAKENGRRTSLERYGTKHPMQNDEIKKKASATVKQRYGVDNVFQLPEAREKIATSLRINGSTGTSEQETEVFEIINSMFPIEQHCYNPDVFPFNVDFYSKKYNLYIEYQGFFTHNKRAYLGTLEDVEEANEIYAKSEEKEKKNGTGSIYLAEIEQWTERDVRKRTMAYERGLNYLEIYSFHDADDIRRQVSLYLNCLLGRKAVDYPQAALQAEFDFYRSLKAGQGALTQPPTRRNLLVKNYQFTEFYKTEMWIYAHNPILRRKVIQNRMKYLGKKEWELTAADIFRGFKISGVHYGYSHFNPAWTNWFVRKYGVRSIYDLCGGWGHHALGMLSCDRIIYNEINEKVAGNVARMKNDFGIDNLEIHVGDGTEYMPDGVDAFFACPPYYNVEEYSGRRYSSLDKYAEFLKSLFRVWDGNSAKIFGLIIREDFAPLIGRQWSERFDVSYGETHFARSSESGGKRFQEKFYIFKK